MLTQVLLFLNLIYHLKLINKKIINDKSQNPGKLILTWVTKNNYNVFKVTSIFST